MLRSERKNSGKFMVRKFFYLKKTNSCQKAAIRPVGRIAAQPI
jgi:hypothetical protein